MSEVGRSTTTSSASEWQKKYPPLLAMVVAVVLALVVLPSSLNLPQTNPTQTLEFAPVPPDDEQPADDQGNTSSLGLGSSSSVEGDGADGEGPGAPPPPPPEPGGRIDIGTRCVGNPPRQTEDPLSPPCVPFWDLEKDNGGETYQGVSRDEVKLIIAIDGGINYSGGSDPSNRIAPRNQVYDLAETPEQCRTSHASAGQAGCDHLIVRGLRVWQTYFNQRFQTYGRNVRFYVTFSEGTGATPERRKAEAAEHLAKIKPFGVVSFLTEGAEDDYLKTMARKGVLNFGSFGLRDSAFYNQYPGMIWSYLPSIEQHSRSYVSYVCQKVVGQNSVLAGPGFNGVPRKLGMIHTSNERTQPGLVLMAQIVKQQVEQCGGKIEAEATFQNCCLARDNGDDDVEEQQQMASFRNQGITTILWPGGGNGNYATAANKVGYLPEWILLGGDSFLDNRTFVFYAQAGKVFDKRAIAVSPHPLTPGLQQQRCFQYFREIDQVYDRRDLSYVCEYYTNLFQFFVGVQVAGPYLGPSQVDKGFHAIPQRQTGDPLVPACFYLPGDFTCVKDAAAYLYSDTDTPPGGTQPGCYLAVERGTRYLPDKWPPGNIDAQLRSDDPCTGYSESVRVNLA